MRSVRVVSMVLVALLLGACGASAVEAPSVTAPEESTPDPTHSPLPTESELLFTITATASTASGASVALSMTVFSPVEFASIPTPLKGSFSDYCLWGGKKASDFGFVHTVIDVTDTSQPGTSWPSTSRTTPFTVTQVLASVGTVSAPSGAWEGFQAACASIFVFPGRTEGALPVLRDVAPDDEGGWASNQYGFSRYDDGGNDGQELAAISDCAITFAPAAGSIRLERTLEGASSDTVNCIFGEQSFYY